MDVIVLLVVFFSCYLTLQKFTVLFKTSNWPLDAHDKINSLYDICHHNKSMDNGTCNIKIMLHEWTEVCMRRPWNSMTIKCMCKLLKPDPFPLPLRAYEQA